MDRLGERLRSQRRAKGLSLRALAGAVGVSAAFISLVERNQAMPSIETLRKLSECLGIPPGELIASTKQRNPVVRRDQRTKLLQPNSPITREILTPGFDHRLEAFEVAMHPGDHSGKDPATHPSEEFIYVLEGTMEFQIGEQVHRLEAHDSITFDGMTPHRTHCVGEGPARYIVIDVPPVV